MDSRSGVERNKKESSWVSVSAIACVPSLSRSHSFSFSLLLSSTQTHTLSLLDTLTLVPCSVGSFEVERRRLMAERQLLSIVFCRLSFVLADRRRLCCCSVSLSRCCCSYFIVCLRAFLAGSLRCNFRMTHFFQRFQPSVVLFPSFDVITVLILCHSLFPIFLVPITVFSVFLSVILRCSVPFLVRSNNTVTTISLVSRRHGFSPGGRLSKISTSIESSWSPNFISVGIIVNRGRLHELV